MSFRWLLIPLFLLLIVACSPASSLDGRTEPKAQESPPTVVPTAEPELLPPESPPAGADKQFDTDFSRHTIPYAEVLSGGPPKDGIPSIDNPTHETIAEADEWLEDREPVVALTLDDQSRAYPIQILTWHEIVNDKLGDVPVSVTFCPLCNTGIAFDRRFDGQVLDFGTTGRLRFSNLIMYDRQTETWWQQATGEGIAGKYAGKRLKLLPAAMISWESYKQAYPQGDVLSRDTGFTRSYGRNPYFGYDDINASPFLYRGSEIPEGLPPMARVATVELEGETVAYPYQALEDKRVVNDRVGTTDLVVLWEPGTASALDTSEISAGRDVGSITIYEREHEGRVLTFMWDDDRIVDEETGSEWNLLGKAVSGPLEGIELDPVVHVNYFWFSWAAFRPETRIYQAGE